jgi:hypothetical protein
MHRRWMRLLGAVFALSLLVAACGGDDPETPGNGAGNGEETPAETDDGGGADLTIVDFGFSPADLSWRSRSKGSRAAASTAGSIPR